MKYFLILFLLPVALSAQTPTCFSDFRKKGLDYMGGKDYGEAISQFVAALVTCKDVPAENDISRLIDESKRKWADDLQASVTEARKLYREAMDSKAMADSAKVAEGVARKKAEENAQNALKRGIRAESFRLALLADMARQQGRKTDAMLLAWMGLQLSDTIQPYVMHAFGEAVRDTFTTTVFNSPEDIVDLQYLGDGQQVLVKTAKPAFFLIRLTAPGGIVELPAFIQQVAISPKGDQLAAWGSNANVLIINAAGKTTATLSGHQENIRNVVFSPDGQKVLTCSRDNSARLWSVNGVLVAELTGHAGNVQAGAFSADGALILTRSSDGTAKTWNLGGQLQGTISDTSNIVYRGYFSASNTIIALFSDQTVHIFDKTGRQLPTPDLGNRRYRLLTTAPNGAYLATSPAPKTVQVFDASGRLTVELTHHTDIVGVQFTPDNQHLLTWGMDNIIRLWSVQGKLENQFKGHRKKVQSVAYLPGKKLLVSSAADGSTKLWDPSGNILAEWTHGTKNTAPASFSPGGDHLLCLAEGGKSAVQSPLPEDILQQADRKSLLNSSAVQQVRQLYNIQFLEQLQR